MKVTASQVAYKAAEIMAERGFAKGRMFDSEGRVCFFGALNLASHALRVTWADDVFTAVAATLLHDRTGQFLRPVAYNDLSSTTGEDVILLLKEIAGRLEELEEEELRGRR